VLAHLHVLELWLNVTPYFHDSLGLSTFEKKGFKLVADILFMLVTLWNVIVMILCSTFLIIIRFVKVFCIHYDIVGSCCRQCRWSWHDSGSLCEIC